jgi:hypothetical protein
MLPRIDPAGSLPTIPDFNAWAEKYAAARDVKEQQSLIAEDHRLAKASRQVIFGIEADEFPLGANASYLRAPVAESASAWIVDDDVPLLTMAATDDTASGAGQEPAIFIVRRSSDTSTPVITLLKNARNGALSPSSFAYTIKDEYVPPPVTVGFTTMTSAASERISPALLLVSLSAAQLTPVTVQYAATGGTATGGGIDYALSPGILMFAPGETVQTIPVTIIDDTIGESNETIVVTLNDPVGAVLNANMTHTLAIRNFAPIAHHDELGAIENRPVSVPFDRLILNDSDEDGDPLSVLTVSAASTNGGVVRILRRSVIYIPATNYVGSDAFTYTIADGRGGTATASVFVTVWDADEPTVNRINQISVTTQGVRLQSSGIPGFNYAIERSTDLRSWTEVAVLTAPANGVVVFTDPNPLSQMAFYRMRICFTCPLVGQSHNAILSWDRSGSHPNVAAYIVKYGTTSGIHTGRVEVAANVTSATVANLVAGHTYFFVVVARNVFGLESHPSAEASYTCPIRNFAPIARNDELNAIENHALTITMGSLLLNDTDEDGDTLSVVTMSGTSTNGGAVAVVGTNVIFTPIINHAGPDLFTYTVSDGRGGTATAAVFVTVRSEHDPSVNKISQITVTSRGVVLQLIGIPGRVYSIERSVDLKSWTEVAVTIAPPTGSFEFIDPNPSSTQAFYRTAILSPPR